MRLEFDARVFQTGTSRAVVIPQATKHGIDTGARVHIVLLSQVEWERLLREATENIVKPELGGPREEEKLPYHRHFRIK